LRRGRGCPPEGTCTRPSWSGAGSRPGVLFGRAGAQEGGVPPSIPGAVGQSPHVGQRTIGGKEGAAAVEGGDPGKGTEEECVLGRLGVGQKQDGATHLGAVVAGLTATIDVPGQGAGSDVVEEQGTLWRRLLDDSHGFWTNIE